MIVSVIARKACEIDGRAIHPGEAVDLSPVKAAIYARQGLVTLDRAARPTYLTRDLVAVAAAPTVPIEAPIEDPEDPTPTRRRRRRTRRSA